MHQVLFTLPILKGVWIFPPDGIPVGGFGAMLFITFVACTVWGTYRGKSVGLDAPRVQDMAIVLFLSGIVGARVLYMIQYSHQFPNDPLGLIGSFFQIWKGGIVFYGSAIGGAIGYGLFYWFVLRRLRIDGWRLADAVAPVLCLGLAIGRIGCYLNGCCWGQIACEETRPVPLGAAHFPLLPAHDRVQLVRQGPNVAYGYVQTSAGFAIAGHNRPDPRSVVIGVEPGSAAEKAGLKVGDKIVRVNGRPNGVVAVLSGKGRENVKSAADQFRKEGLRVEESEGEPEDKPEDKRERSTRVYFDEYAQYAQALDRTQSGTLPVTLIASDYLWEEVVHWPRGRAELSLGVLRDGQEIDLPAFTPRTVGLYPTQLYETLSMVLLIFLLLAYYPFRRHDGQLLILCMLGYAIHRFINESIRIEPSYALGLTLSQWGSVVIAAAALGLEAYLWRVMPSRWALKREGSPQRHADHTKGHQEDKK
jgi:prolipoprotein diacylglyceryltransferase